MGQQTIHVPAVGPGTICIRSQCHGRSEIFSSVGAKLIRDIAHHQDAADGQFIQVCASRVIAVVVPRDPHLGGNLDQSEVKRRFFFVTNQDPEPCAVGGSEIATCQNLTKAHGFKP